MEESTNQKIVVMPFQYVEAFSDVESGQIFVSRSFVEENVAENIAHELAHINSGDPDHGVRFKEILQGFGYKYNRNKDTFASIRKRCGIQSSIAANIGNISGIQNILTDYHLLQAYRKFSQKVLGTEGHWEVIGEGDGDATDQLIRLYPTPKGSFPVVVLYYPVVTAFRSPQARAVAFEMMEAEARIALGNARRKVSGMPSPDGGTIQWDGSDMVQEGIKMKEEIIQKAIDLGEPLGVYLW